PRAVGGAPHEARVGGEVRPRRVHDRTRRAGRPRRPPAGEDPHGGAPRGARAATPPGRQGEGARRPPKSTTPGLIGANLRTGQGWYMLPAAGARGIWEVPMASPVARRGTGWVAFAGVILILAGLLDIVNGLYALDHQDRPVDALFFKNNLEAWGWFYVIVGIV